MSKKDTMGRGAGKWGAISLKDINEEYNVSLESNVIKIKFSFKHKTSVTTKWEPDDSSLRVYYRKYNASGEPIAEAEHIDILPENCEKFSKGKKSTTVVYNITGLDSETIYNVNIWLRLYSYKVEKTTVIVDGQSVEQDVEVPTKLKKPIYKTGSQTQITSSAIIVSEDENKRTLFQITKYRWNEGNSQYDRSFIDFTNCITLPSYEVNREDVTETWDDANYDQHVIVPTRKIKGKFSMLFPSMERYNEFMDLIYQAKMLNDWSPGACVRLRVQVNNELDYNNSVNIAKAIPVHEIGNFTIKIDNNPWVKPVFGHFDRYSPLNVTIEQVDTLTEED